MNQMNEVFNFNRQTITEGELIAKLKEVAATLKVLDISETYISSLYFLKQVPLNNLEELNISYLNIDDFKLLRELKNLKILYANHLYIQKIDLSGNLKLKKLSLEFNLIRDTKFLEPNKELEFLSLTGNELLEDISSLNNLQQIKELYLQGTGIVRREQIEALDGKTFETLVVDGNLASQASVLTKPLANNKILKPQLSRRVNLDQLLAEKNAIQVMAKKCSIKELYFIEPEKRMGLYFLGKMHFFVIPAKGKMSNDDLYDFKNFLIELFDCTTVFIATEGHLKDLLVRNILSEEEYQLATQKNQNILVDTSANKIDSQNEKIEYSVRFSI